MATFIVHGPMACGKTRNREVIAQHLVGDACRCLEIDEPSVKPRDGFVHLTNDLSTAIKKLSRAKIGVFTVVAFADLPIPTRCRSSS